MPLTRRLMVCMILTLASTVLAQTPGADTPTIGRKGLAIIGASASAGWGVVVPILKPSEGNRFRHVHLADALHAVDPNLPRPVTSSGSPGFFRTSLKGRQRIVDLAIASNPEAVSAIDFLFWYGYGSVWEDNAAAEAQRRAATLEAGLTQLDRIAAMGVPVVVGDLPDVNDALEAKPFSFLGRAQVPSPEMIKSMNERIKNWAKTHSNVRLLGLGAVVGDMKAGKQVLAGGVVWGPEPRMMQNDRLHPSAEGLLALAAATAEQLQISLGRQPLTIDKEAVRLAIRRHDAPAATAP